MHCEAKFCGMATGECSHCEAKFCGEGTGVRTGDAIRARRGSKRGWGFGAWLCALC